MQLSRNQTSNHQQQARSTKQAVCSPHFGDNMYLESDVMQSRLGVPPKRNADALYTTLPLVPDKQLPPVCPFPTGVVLGRGVSSLPHHKMTLGHRGSIHTFSICCLFSRCLWPNYIKMAPVNILEFSGSPFVINEEKSVTYDGFSSAEVTVTSKTVGRHPSVTLGLLC